MPWFRHEATAHRDPRIIELIDEFGPAGHFVWWQLNEVCCLEDGPIVFPEGNWKRAARLLDIPPELKIPLDKVVEFLVQNRLISRTKTRATLSLEPTNRVKYLPPKSQTPEAQRERKRRSRAKRSRNGHSDMSHPGHSDTSTHVTPYETKRNETSKDLVPSEPAKPERAVTAIASKHLETLHPKLAQGSGYDLLYEFKEVWPLAWQEAAAQGVNPKAVGINLIGRFIATVTDTEPDYGRAGQLVGRFGKLALLGIDEGLMANADDPYRYAFAVCKNKAQESRAEATT